MDTDTAHAMPSLAERVTTMIEVVHRPAEAPATSAEAAAGASELGPEHLSEDLIEALRTGDDQLRATPEQLAQLARYFLLDPVFLLDDDPARADAILGDLELLSAIRDTGIHEMRVCGPRPAEALTNRERAQLLRIFEQALQEDRTAPSRDPAPGTPAEEPTAAKTIRPGAEDPPPRRWRLPWRRAR